MSMVVFWVEMPCGLVGESTFNPNGVTTQETNMNKIIIKKFITEKKIRSGI
jgi:hypothetical protein